MDTSARQEKRSYLIRNEFLNALTHGIAAGISLIGLILLIYKGILRQDGVELISYIIYGLSLILLYTSSTIYHSFKFTKYGKTLRRLDHCSIFILIAGTYTPFALVAVGGNFGIFITVVVWLIAFFGVLYKIFWFNKFKGLSIYIYLLMGWLIIFFPVQLFRALNWQGLLFLALGGLAFTVGTIFYRMSHVKYMHVVWHLFVMLGTSFMFVSILLYV